MKKYVLSLALLVSVSLAAPVEATNGYWTHGYGPKSKSMAGACVAMAFGAMCAASNPASLAVVGNRIEVGASLFAPKRGYTADANLPPGMAPIEPGKVESENDLFLIPHFAANYKRVVMLRMQNGTSKSPFCPRLSRRLFPFAAAALRPGHYVNPSQARIRLRTPTSNGSTAFRMPTLHPLWRKARRVCCERPTPTADYQPSFHSPWLAAYVG